MEYVGADVLREIHSLSQRLGQTKAGEGGAGAGGPQADLGARGPKAPTMKTAKQILDVSRAPATPSTGDFQGGWPECASVNAFGATAVV
eukprot:9148153-Pyramimonas_sp.AAC.1